MAKNLAKVLEVLDKQHQQMQEMMKANRASVKRQQKHPVFRFTEYNKLPDETKNEIAGLPADGFGDEAIMNSLFQDLENAEAKKKEELYRRYLDRILMFEPSLHYDEVELRKYMKCYQKLMNLKESEPESYEEAIEKCFLTVTDRTRFEAKKEMFDVVYKSVRGAVDKKYAEQAADRVNANMDSLDNPSAGVIEDRWPAQYDEDHFAEDLHKFADSQRLDTATETLKRAADLFDHTFSRYNGKDYQKMMKETGMDLFDLITIGGVSVRKAAEDALYDTNDKDRLEAVMKAMVVDAVYSGRHVDVAVLNRLPANGIEVTVSSLHVDLKELGDVQYNRKSTWRRAFDWLFKIETTARKTASLYADDKEAAARHNQLTKEFKGRIQEVRKKAADEEKKRIDAEKKKAEEAEKARLKKLSSLTDPKRWENEWILDRVDKLGVLMMHKMLTFLEKNEIKEKMGEDKILAAGRQFYLMAAMDPSSNLEEMFCIAEKYDNKLTDQEEKTAEGFCMKYGENAPKEQKNNDALIKNAAAYIQKHGLDKTGAQLAIVCSEMIKAEYKEENRTDEMRGMIALGEAAYKYTKQFWYLPKNPQHVDADAIKTFRFLKTLSMKETEGKQTMNILSILGKDDYRIPDKEGRMVKVNGRDFLKHVMKNTAAGLHADLNEMIDGEHYAAELFEKGLKEFQREFNASVKSKEALKQKDPDLKEKVQEVPELKLAAA